MRLKKIIYSSIFWRSLFSVSALLLNILVSRYFGAINSGKVYYSINYLSFIILVASLSLDSGMGFFGAKNAIKTSSLAMFSFVWTLVASGTICLFIILSYQQQDQLLPRWQFIYFGVVYAAGCLLTAFFTALFFARQRFALPNIVLASCNVALSICFFFGLKFNRTNLTDQFFLHLYFISFLVQGLLLSAVYTLKNKILFHWSFPGRSELKMLFRFSLFALLNNLIFFLLYRIDYWFLKNICASCQEGDLGNYIQVSKIGQVFLVLPVIVASAIFPRTASGLHKEVNAGLPVFSRVIMGLYLLILGFLAITGKWLFPWIYGETFNRIYLPFLLLIPGILALADISLLSAYNSGKDKLLINMKGSVIGLVIILTGDWLFIPGHGINAAALVSSAGYIGYLVYLLYTFSKEYQISVANFFIPTTSDWLKFKRIIVRHEKD